MPAPLTLMLSPLDDIINACPQEKPIMSHLQIIRRLDYIIDIPCSNEFNQIIGGKIYLDHDMFETIVFNLCSNALKHTWNGCITIRLYPDYKDKKKKIVLEELESVRQELYEEFLKQRIFGLEKTLKSLLCHKNDILRKDDS
ncbi:hypothetical protein C2G38_2217786 [Gigaspora rosea]|uniref:Histidine kinase/HSP90-like ATPase domain-containing protein n=1 Tax=Gigaspora rosea TaxID=44941 RepID=A0A397UFU2_9GLOM|nr:hypothetical protein C2G38_2217786 [Gigaspora rosea]